MSDLDKINDDSPDDGLGDGDQGVNEPVFKAITTQEDFDKAVQRRLARVENKYKGYDDFKSKAEKLDQIEAERGSENEKLLRRAEKAEQELATERAKTAKSERLELVRDIADELGLPAKMVKRVQGDTEEDIRSDIEDLLESLPSSKKLDDGDGGDKDKKPPTQKPKQKMTFTTTGDESDDGLDVSADDILKDINGG